MSRLFASPAARWPVVGLCGLATAVVATMRLTPAVMIPVLIAGAVFAVIAAWSQFAALLVLFPLFGVIPPAMQAARPDTVQVTLISLFLAGYVLAGLDVDWHAPAFRAAIAGVLVAAVVSALSSHATVGAALFGIGVAALIGGYLLSVTPARTPDQPTEG